MPTQLLIEDEGPTAGYLLCRHGCGWSLPYPSFDVQAVAEQFRKAHEKRCRNARPRSIGDLPW